MMYVGYPRRGAPFQVRKQLQEQLWCDRDLGLMERVYWRPHIFGVPHCGYTELKSPGKNRVGVSMGQQNRLMMEMIGELNGALNSACWT